jgi:regulator of protease activity HflC (stomatin/prohibitin superfamily)
MVVALLMLISYQFVISKISPEVKKLPNIAFGLLLIIFTLFAVNPFRTVPAGSKGVLVTFGDVQKDLPAGLHIIMPVVQNIKNITLKPIGFDYEIDVGAQACISRDNQSLGLKMSYFFKYDPTKIVSVYKEFGEEQIKSIINKSAVECVKGEIGKYTIYDIAMSQSKIQSEVYSVLKSKLSLYPIELTELKITNYDWSDDFDTQIKATMNRTQEVKRKEQELLISEQEAQKVVKIAEAEKTAMILKAQGDSATASLRAKAKELEGEGIRKFNESVAKNTSLEIEIRKLEIEKIKAEKWNGQYVSTNNYGPIPIQSGSLIPSR